MKLKYLIRKIRPYELLSELSEHSDEDFKIWVKSLLTNPRNIPEIRYSIREFPHDFLADLYRSTKNVAFQVRLRSAVLSLFKEWNINARNTETPEYVVSLLNLIADLPINEAYPSLLSRAQSGLFAGIYSSYEKWDMQTIILQILAEMLYEHRSEDDNLLRLLLDKYCSDVDYFPYCFKILFKRDFSQSPKHLVSLFALWRRSKFDIQSLLEEYLQACRVGGFVQIAKSVFAFLEEGVLITEFLETASEVGLNINVFNMPLVYGAPSRAGLRIWWNVYGQKTEFHFIDLPNETILNKVWEYQKKRTKNILREDQAFEQIIVPNFLDSLEILPV
jgi:hypothetical protein